MAEFRGRTAIRSSERRRAEEKNSRVTLVFEVSSKFRRFAQETRRRKTSPPLPEPTRKDGAPRIVQKGPATRQRDFSDVCSSSKPPSEYIICARPFVGRRRMRGCRILVLFKGAGFDFSAAACFAGTTRCLEWLRPIRKCGCLPASLLLGPEYIG